MKTIKDEMLDNKHLNKMKEIMAFSVHPFDTLEDNFTPDTDDYKERRKQINGMKTQIRQSEKDLNLLFGLVLNFNQYVADVRFMDKTAFNTQAIKSLAFTYGSIDRTISDLSKVDKKLSKASVYKDVYSKLSEALDVNLFDMFIDDIERLIVKANDKKNKFNETALDNYKQDVELDNQTYIESYKEGLKVKPQLMTL